MTVDIPSQVTLDFNPRTEPHRDDPHMFYREARRLGPVLTPTLGAYAVARHQDLLDVLADPETYSSAVAVPKAYSSEPEVVAELERSSYPETDALVNEDGPEHTAHRKLFETGVTGARVRALVPAMRDKANELIDAFGNDPRDPRDPRDPDGPVDLVARYAAPFVQFVINRIIGFPDEDAARVQAWTNDVATIWNLLSPVESRIAAAKRLAGYTRYLQDLIDDRRANPRADMISDLVHGSDGRPGLPDDHVHSYIRGSVRIAGYDTTRDGITAAVLLYLTTPEVRARFAANPTATIPRLIEETLRRDAPHRGLFRVTTRAVTLGGTDLPAGALLLLMFGSGNRDETVFTDPDAADLDRPNVRSHLAFGKGKHACPGAPLARAEIRVALETLLNRVPTLELAPGYRPAYVPNPFVRGLKTLMVTR